MQWVESQHKFWYELRWKKRERKRLCLRSWGKQWRTDLQTVFRIPDCFPLNRVSRIHPYPFFVYLQYTYWIILIIWAFGLIWCGHFFSLAWPVSFWHALFSFVVANRDYGRSGWEAERCTSHGSGRYRISPRSWAPLPFSCRGLMMSSFTCRPGICGQTLARPRARREGLQSIQLAA